MTGSRETGTVQHGALDGVPKADGTTIRDASTEIRWDPRSRVALVRYATDTHLTAPAGALLVDALTGWIGEGGEPFGVLADGTGLLRN